jgi:hypothetical protein
MVRPGPSAGNDPLAGRPTLHEGFTRVRDLEKMTTGGRAMVAGAGDRPLFERLFAPIEDRDGARVLAGDLGKALIAVALVQTVLALARGPGALADAALYALGGAVIWATASRLSAVIVLLVSALSSVLTLLDLLGPIRTSGGRNIILALVAVWIAGRAVQATFDYRRFGSTGGSAPGGDEGPKPSAD